MPNLEHESCTRLWDMASAITNGNSELSEVRIDNTSPQGKSFVFYTIEGQKEVAEVLFANQIPETQMLYREIREQWATKPKNEKEAGNVFSLPSYLGLPSFSIKRIGSFFVYIKSEGRADETEKEEELLISPYKTIVFGWMKAYYKIQKDRLYGLKNSQSQKIYEPIVQQLENSVGDLEKLAKIFKAKYQLGNNFILNEPEKNEQNAGT